MSHEWLMGMLQRAERTAGKKSWQRGVKKHAISMGITSGVDGARQLDRGLACIDPLKTDDK